MVAWEPGTLSLEHEDKPEAAFLCKLIIKCFPSAGFLPIQHHGNSFIPLLGSSVATATGPDSSTGEESEAEPPEEE